MNKKLLIGLIIALLLIVGGVLGFRMFGGKTVSTNDRAVVDSNTETGTEEAPASLKDLLQKGVAQKCSFSQSGDYSSQGNIYVSGGKVRGDFDSLVQGKTTKAHMIVENNTSYLWTDDAPSGFKTSFDINGAVEDLDTDTSQPDDVSNSFDANADLNYNCTPWVVDDSVFTLPSGVTFADMNAQLQSQCGACESLTGDAKTQCKTALKCS